MARQSDNPASDDALRASIIGLGSLSGRKSYFPELKRRLDELERISAKLRVSEARFRTIFDCINDAIFIHDIDSGAILDVNLRMTELYGYSREEAVHLRIADLSVGKPPFTQEEGLARIQAAKDGKPQLFEWMAKSKGGAVFWVDVSLRKALIGNAEAILVTARDISSRKMLEAQLDQARKMECIGRLAGGVAHDFNNMLAVIIGRAELAMSRLRPDDPVNSSFKEILKAAQSSAGIARQLLAFARKQPASPKVLDPNDSFEAMLSMLLRLVGEAIKLRWEPGPGIWPVKIDNSQLEQIAFNLVINARDAIQSHGSILIETRNVKVEASACHADFDCLPGDYVMISVSDDGSGMDEETLKHIFEPFFTTKELGKGTGLGLATVYGIVKQNNGFIEVVSNEGEGSAFKVFLPRSFRDGATDAAPAELDVRGGRESVLLVEDEATLLFLSKEILESSGYNVIAFESSKMALAFAKLEPGRIDLLVTDVVMPELNGKMLFETLRKSRPDLKCLFMSGYACDVITRLDIQDEGVDFIQKPFGYEALSAKVRRILDNSR